jgi:hypothetical protein
MKLTRRPSSKVVDYFGIEFELDEYFRGYIQTHSDGFVFANETNWDGSFVSSTFLGVVDLEGMDWRDTMVEVE